MIANALSGGGFNGRRRMPHVIENHGHAPRIAPIRKIVITMG